MIDTIVDKYYNQIRDRSLIQLHYSHNCLSIHKNLTNEDLNKKENFKKYIENNPNCRLVSIYNEYEPLHDEIVKIENKLEGYHKEYRKYVDQYKATKKKYGIFPNKLQRRLIKEVKNKYQVLEFKIDELTLQQQQKGKAYHCLRDRTNTILKMTTREYIGWLSGYKTNDSTTNQ